MNADIKAQWVNALRSGDYEQGRGWLNNNGKFCCLGVLCDLAEKAGVVRSGPLEVEGAMDPAPLAYFTSDTLINLNDRMMLPRAVVQWAEMSVTDPDRITNPDTGEADTLINLNDELGYDFERIAQVIEWQL